PELFQTATDYLIVEAGELRMTLTLAELEAQTQQYLEVAAEDPAPSSPRSRSPGRRPSPASCPAGGCACPTTPTRPSRCCAPSSPRTYGPRAWPARARASNRSSCPSSEETDHDQPAARGAVRDPPHRSRPALPRRHR